MTEKERNLLQKINNLAMRSEDTRDLIKSVDLYAENRETLKRIVDDTRLSENARKIARQMLEDPRMYKRGEQVDMDKAKIVENTVEQDIKRAIKQGYLEDPSKSVEEFMRDKK